MIIKYVYDEHVICKQYESEQAFLKDCDTVEFKDILLNSKDVIVLENNGTNYSYNTLLEVYQRYRSYAI